MSSTTSESQSTNQREESDLLSGLAERVDHAFSEVQSMPAEMRNKAVALKSAIEEFHKIGLTHIVKHLKSDPRGKELLFELVDEPAVYALFSMHGLVRADLRTQVIRVLEMVRPYMNSHGGDVELVDVRDKIVYVRLTGNCQGCSMSTVTLRTTVEESLRQHIPEIEAVEVTDKVEESSVQRDSQLVQLQFRGLRREDDHGWVAGPMLAEIQDQKPFEFAHGGDSILLLKTRDGLKAYRNACAHQGLPLDGGSFEPETGKLTCPWHGFEFDGQSGECLSAPQCQLEPFPLRIIDERVWVRPQS